MSGQGIVLRIVEDLTDHVQQAAAGAVTDKLCRVAGRFQLLGQLVQVQGETGIGRQLGWWLFGVHRALLVRLTVLGM